MLSGDKRENMFRKILSTFSPRKKLKRLGRGKTIFEADRIKKSAQAKTINTSWGKEIARGSQGAAFDLEVFKGTHKTNLVIKKYHIFFGQSKFAQKEFKIFQKLKAAGYHVPPTIRLVRINDKKYLALTDLSKLGDLQIAVKSRHNLDLLKGTLPGIEEKEITKALDLIKKENERARKEFGIKLHDSWELIVNNKNKTVKPFILDLGTSPALSWRDKFGY